MSGPSSELTDLQERPLRVALAVLLLALTGAGFLLHAALVRGARAEAFRVAILVGEGDIGILPAPGGTDAPALIPDAGPLYTQPELMRSGALVMPRVTLPVAVGERDELAVLHGVEPADPQAALIQQGHLLGKWPTDRAGVAMGIALAKALRLHVGDAVDLALDKPDAEPVTVRVVGLVQTGREEWDAHGLWSGLTLARTVRGIHDPRDSEAVTHLAVFLPDPAASGEWRDRILRMALPDFTEVREWWQLDLEPLRYAPQADPGLPWATAMLAMLVAGMIANLLLGPASLPYVGGGQVPAERELRLRVLRALGVQGAFLAVSAVAVGAVIVLAARLGFAIGGSGPLHPERFLPPAAERLGQLMRPSFIPQWGWLDAVEMTVVTLIAVPLAGSVRLWRIGALRAAQPPTSRW